MLVGAHIWGFRECELLRVHSRGLEGCGMHVCAGCLPTLATIPIFWGLYRTLSNVASAGLLTEGFYWIPSLSGPTSLAAQRAGATPLCHALRPGNSCPRDRET